MMKKERNKKTYALILVLCLILQMTGGASSVEARCQKIPADNTVRTVNKTAANMVSNAADNKSNKTEAPVISILSVTGSAISTYYVGGTGASNSNPGTEGTAPFATLARATQEINGQGAGDYEIIVQGNTTETERSLIGDGVGDYDVAIHAVTGSAIVLRAEACTGDLITVTNGSKLTLGDSTGTFTSDLTLDGGKYYGNDKSKGSFINVNTQGTLVIYSHAILEHSINIQSTNKGHGGAILNGGTLRMYGGIVQDNAADSGSGIYNSGTLQLYGGTIQDNFYAGFGSGVYNQENAAFEMYDGLIYSNDSDSYAGGVANYGTFKLSGGSIDGNYANSNGGIYNGYKGIFEMTGGSITNNKADYCAGGVSNGGSFTMSGGTISHNYCTLSDFGWGFSYGGGISNYSEFIMTDGVIEENTSHDGSAIYNSTDGKVRISGGTIQNNISTRGAVYNKGELTVSGSIEIPGGTGNGNSVYLEKPLTIGGALTGSSNIALTLDNFSGTVGSQMLNEASAGLISGNYARFISTNNDFRINNLGTIEYIGLPRTYYVGGTGAIDTNDGTESDKAFATLQHAFEVGNDRTATFILQSDQEVGNRIIVKGNITIKSDGTPRRITRSGSFTGDNLFYIGEKAVLTLGDSQNNDTAETLIIDGKNESNLSIDLIKIDKGVMNLYSGAAIKNNNLRRVTIKNYGTFNMYGGNIENNAATDWAVVYNYNIMNMTGGTIRNNNGIGICNSVETDPFESYTGTLHMSGGTIYSNSSDQGSGIKNEGKLYLSKAASFPTVNNKQDEIYMTGFDSSITLEGGLTGSDNFPVSMYAYVDGSQVIYGEESYLKDYCSRFLLKNPDYHINEQGCVMYGKAKPTFYVNAAGNDANAGSITAPFATLKRAVEEINGGAGTIILQSDLTIYEPLVITGTVTLLSDGQLRTIYRGEPFTSYTKSGELTSYTMFMVYGRLDLGSSTGGSDLAPNLVLDGGGEKGITAKGSIITSYGNLNMNAGVILQNNNAGNLEHFAVLSYGEFNMYGGSIQKNSTHQSGVYISGGTFTMNAGAVRDNKGKYAGVIIGSGTFIMNSGSISGNTAAGDGSFAGVFSLGGTIIMNGGTVLNNQGESAGVTLEQGTFIMNDGSISGNNNGAESNSFTGVYISDGNFKMNGGDINGNRGSYSGVCMDTGNITITGGSIRENNGDLAGIITRYEGTIKMTGGSVTDNKGYVAGIYTGNGFTLDLSGGTIGSNTASVGYAGIYTFKNNINLSGNTVISGGDQIILAEQNSVPKINITAPLTGAAGAFQVSIITASNTPGSIIPKYEIGRQVLLSGKAYTFTEEDVKKFKLANDNFGINPEGKIGTRIKDNDVTLAYSNIIYNGKNQTVYITVKNAQNILEEGKDYTVSYANNQNAGTASVTVTGIGAYAGEILKKFSIGKAWVTSILTDPPATLIFSAKDKKTPEELLNSIQLDYVHVAVNNGIYAYFPVQWSLITGTYNPKGGTYTYTGTVIGDTNIDAGGVKLTAQIIVKPEEPYHRGTENISTGTGSITADISYYDAGTILNVEYVLPEISEQGAEERIVIPVSSVDMQKQLEKEEFTELNISVSLSDSILNDNGTDRLGMLMKAEFIKKAKELGKNITVSVKDKSGKELYTWTFTGENLMNSTREITDVDLNINLEELGEAEGLKELYDEASGLSDNAQGLVINFGHDGVLPAQAGIRLYVGDRKGISPGSSIYLYHYNQSAKKLETLPYSTGYIVDKDGYITIDILHCSDYVMLTKEADQAKIISLKNQISVSAGSDTLYLGGTEDSYTKVIVNLPDTLELVDSLKTKTTQSAIGGVAVSYRSSNEKVATVDTDGKVTAKGTGLTAIYVKLNLYNGKTKTLKIFITVKKAK